MMLLTGTGAEGGGICRHPHDRPALLRLCTAGSPIGMRDGRLKDDIDTPCLARLSSNRLKMTLAVGRHNAIASLSFFSKRPVPSLHGKRVWKLKER
jgi:hypothetical protein